MRTVSGIVGLGRKAVPTQPPAAEVTAGNDKFDTTNRLNEPTSPGVDFNPIAVDNRVLSFPAVPGRHGKKRNKHVGRVAVTEIYVSNCAPRAYAAYRAILDMQRHPSKPSDDYIVRRAAKVLRHG